MVDLTDFIYWPGTCHPSLDEEAATIRDRITRGESSFQYAVMPVLHASYGVEPPPMSFEMPKIETLTVRKAVGPAPYVGRPFVYTWKVAVGEGNRWVAGPAEIHYLPDEPISELYVPGIGTYR